ncbi:hypothetical protein DMA11_21780 [Marinilabiliaceae bacterium JC017]|nr:hypothetical protein DMA11_21780 [Marinilabiliaceae bacterium JC017]
MDKTKLYLETELIKQFMPMVQAMESAFSKTLEEYFENDKINQILLFTRKHFEEAQGTLPNVGPQSPWLKNMIGITYEIGLWKELIKLNLSLDEISILTQKTLKLISQKSFPTESIKKIGSMLCSTSYIKKIADSSQKKEYPDDWVFECVLPGPKDNFQIGLNIHKCPISLLCKRFNAEDFFPYLCLNDYITHSMLGISLDRTKTIAHGAEICDFRLTQTQKPFSNIKQPKETKEFKNNIKYTQKPN